MRRSLVRDEWINGAYFVLEPGVLDYIAGDGTRFEPDMLTRLAQDSELMAYRHDAFWQCMDTLHEAQELNALWAADQAPLGDLVLAAHGLRSRAAPR